MNGQVHYNQHRNGRSRSRPVSGRKQHNPASLQWDGNFFAQEQHMNDPMNMPSPHNHNSNPQAICQKYNQKQQKPSVRFHSPPPPRIPRRKSRKHNESTVANYGSPTNSRHSKRAATFTHRGDIMQSPITPVQRAMRAKTVAPKQVPDIMPKDELTKFLITHDLTELRPQLQHNQIEVEHLLFVDANDLNELCVDLHLSAPQKIRFKFAVNQLQHTHKYGAEEKNKPLPPNYINDLSKTQSATIVKQKKRMPGMIRAKSANNMGQQGTNHVPHANTMVTNLQYHFHGYNDTSPQASPLVQSETSALHLQEDQEEKLPPLPRPQMDNQNYSNSTQQLNVPMGAAESRSLSLPGLPGHVPTHPRQQLPLQMSHSQGRFVPPAPQHTRHRNQTVSIGSGAFVPQKQRSYTPDEADNKPSRILVTNSNPTQSKAKHRRIRRNSIGTPTMSNANTKFVRSAWSEWHEQWKSVIRESAKNRNEISMQSSIHCTAVTQCCCIKRIVYLMRFYLQFRNKGLEMMEMMKTIQLKEYTVIDLLNDHYHIQEYHKQRDADLHYICEEMKGATATICCKINECPMIKRINLCQYAEYILFYCGLSNVDDVICIQLLDKIHCSYLHCYDLYRFSVEENKELQAAAASNLQSQSNTNEYLLHTAYYAMVKQFMDRKNFNLKEVKGVYKCNESSKYSTPWSHVHNEFGRKYIYSAQLQAQQQYDPQNGEYIVARHSNFKQEMLNNESAAISNKDWNVSLRKCQNYYFHTNKIKQFQHKMDIQIMLCLYVFVNFEHVAPRFIAGYFGKESSSASAFAHFARILLNALSMYGLSFAANYNFFHGLVGTRESNAKSDHGAFIDDIVLKFECPMLTTSRFEVIYNYHTFALTHEHQHGVILNVTKSSHCRYEYKFINTSWFANVECEESQIFLAESPMKPVEFRIASIIDLRCCANYYYYLNAMYVLRCILWQQSVDEKQLRITKEIYIALQILIEFVSSPLQQQKLKPRHNNADQMVNILKLFTTICYAQKRIKINILQIVDMFSTQQFLLNYFLRCSGRDLYTLNIENLVKLYPNMSSLSISSQYLHQSVFEELLKNEKSIPNHVDFNNIRYRKHKNVFDSIGAALKEYVDPFESIGYRLEQDQRIDNVLVLSKQNYPFEMTSNTAISVTIRDPIRNSMAIDYSNMAVNTYQEHIYEIKLTLPPIIIINVTYDDLSELHEWMTKKRLKLKTKLPSKQKKRIKEIQNKEREKQQMKVEAYLKHLFLLVTKHKNQMFKRHLAAFIIQNKVN